MSNLPAHRHSADCDCYAADLTAYREQQPAQQIVHIHEAAAPDRTLQRVALGSGMGAGAVAAGVYFGPLLVAAMASMAASLAILAVIVAVCAWAIVTVIRAVGGTDGKAAAEVVRKGRRRR